ncbi:helix-turn-helix domain-containing protein [Microbacterium sp.]|jgi:AraC-like DNA-binding protein|uniref:helix-turn-helix domain-containing protein n=1 Tax=Microbacterium sp. TaxID=51671 RepID=UPI002B7E52E7|nr:helix-turn-helix domain-containing protein [Microbacterium sp.]HWL77460.1 helix-turn-helix domain-containing protein [Microbacterium sp.]
MDPTRGILYPARLPRLTRVPPAAEATDLVEWFWIPEWDIAPGRSSRQEIVAYPASNLVVEGGDVGLFGPTTLRSHRDLTGRGWAVGALLRPAALGALTADAAALVDASVSIDAPELVRAVSEAMGDPDAAIRHARAVEAFSSWLARRVGALDDEQRLANDAAALLMTDPEILRVEDAAARLAVSVRTLQRLARRYVGLTPSAMIRRRRLQEAAQRVRDDPDADLAAIAAELGYADHAHLTNDFRTVLAFTPSSYRHATTLS